MATFQARVEDYTGSFTDTAALTDWLTAGARKLVDLIPEDKALQYSTSQTIADAGQACTGFRYLTVNYNGRRCRPIPNGLESQSTDTASIWYATTSDPCFFVRDSKLFIKPAGGGASAVAQILSYPTVLFSDSSISNYPLYLEQTVVLYAAIQALEQQLNTDVRTDEDIEKAAAQERMLATVKNEYERCLMIYFGKGQKNDSR